VSSSSSLGTGSNPSSTSAATSSSTALSLTPSYFLSVAPALTVIILLLAVQAVVRRTRPAGDRPAKIG
jgi:hypothetical protein